MSLSYMSKKYVYAIVDMLGTEQSIAVFTTKELRDESYNKLKGIFGGEEGPRFYIRKNTYLLLDRSLNSGELKAAEVLFHEILE